MKIILSKSDNGLYYPEVIVVHSVQLAIFRAIIVDYETAIWNFNNGVEFQYKNWDFVMLDMFGGGYFSPPPAYLKLVNDMIGIPVTNRNLSRMRYRVAYIHYVYSSTKPVFYESEYDWILNEPYESCPVKIYGYGNLEEEAFENMVKHVSKVNNDLIDMKLNVIPYEEVDYAESYI